jgi:hypothetical protein
LELKSCVIMGWWYLSAGSGFASNSGCLLWLGV